MKHLKQFNESLSDHSISGKKPKEELADYVWNILKRALDTGYATSYKILPEEWRESSKLAALDDMLGIFTDVKRKKRLFITVVDSEKPLEFKLIEEDAVKTRNIYPPKGSAGSGLPMKVIKTNFTQYVIVPEEYDDFEKLKQKALDFAQKSKKTKKTITGGDGVEYPNSEIKTVLKRWSPSYVELLDTFYDSGNERQLKNGSIELTRKTSTFSRPTYMVSKSGKVYWTAGRGAVLLLRPALQHVDDYEKCFKFLIEREKQKMKKI